MAEKIYTTFPGCETWEKDLVWLAQSYCTAVAEEIHSSSYRLWRSIDPAKWKEVALMLDQLLRDRTRSILAVAVDEGLYVGYFLGLVKECVAETPSRVGYVNGVYVIPERRSSGIGSRLLDQGMEWFRANDINAVELYVARENEGAKRFWRRRGYQVVEEVMALSLKK